MVDSDEPYEVIDETHVFSRDQWERLTAALRTSPESILPGRARLNGRVHSYHWPTTEPHWAFAKLRTGELMDTATAEMLMRQLRTGRVEPGEPDLAGEQISALGDALRRLARTARTARLGGAMTYPTPIELHNAVLTAARKRYYTAVYQHGPASTEAVGLAGRRRILERHPPAGYAATRSNGDYCGRTLCDEAEAGWPCPDYRDAAAGLNVALPDPDASRTARDEQSEVRAMTPEEIAGRDFARQEGVPDVADDDSRFTLLDPGRVVFRQPSSAWAELVFDNGIWTARQAVDAFAGLLDESFAGLVRTLSQPPLPPPLLVNMTPRGRPYDDGQHGRGRHPRVGEPRESRSTTVTDHVELKAARVVPIRELGEDLSAALARINNSGEPTLVSQHGQFVALITPLVGQRIESRALADDPVLREELRNEAARAAADPDADLSIAEVRARLRTTS